MSNSLYIKQWKRRERAYTRRYAVMVFRVLNSQALKAAKEYKNLSTFTVDSEPMLKVYKKIYDQVVRQEAEIVINGMFGRKDILSSIIRFFNLSEDQITVRFIRDLMQQYFDVYVMQRLLQVTESTKKIIQEIIQSGLDRGLKTSEIARMIVDRSKEINKTRAVRIARTETVTAANRSQLLVHEASPFEYEKSWLPVVDDRTRSSHIAMNPRVFIDLWDKFKVRNKDGVFEEMLTPGDTEASASNVVNCRCTMLYRVKRDSNGRPIRKNSLEI